MAGEHNRDQALQSTSSSATVRESGTVDGADEDTSSQKRSRYHLSDSNCGESRWIRLHLDSKSAADERRPNLEEFRLEINK